MATLIRELRANPERYQAFRDSVLEADSDEARTRLLVHFATTDEDLRKLAPPGHGPVAITTTVTTTTVLITES